MIASSSSQNLLPNKTFPKEGIVDVEAKQTPSTAVLEVSLLLRRLKLFQAPPAKVLLAVDTFHRVATTVLLDGDVTLGTVLDVARFSHPHFELLLLLVLPA